PIIGHYQASFRHPDRDKSHGRIWRVTAKGRPLTRPPAFADASTADLLNFLDSPDRWTRHFARRVLADQPTETLSPVLNKYTTTPGLSDHALKEALGVYQSHELVAPDLLARLIRARDLGARAYAAAVIGLWADRLPDPLALLRPLVADENPRVRLQAIVASTYVRSAETIEVTLIAGDYPTDRFLDYALRQAVFSLKPLWRAPFREGKLSFGNRESRLGWLVRADGTADTIEAVRQLLRSPTPDSVARETYWRLLADAGNADDFAAALSLKDAALQETILPAFTSVTRSRKLRPRGDLEALLRPLLSAQKPGVRNEAMRLAGIWKVESLRSQVRASALDSKAEPPLRFSAIESLGAFADESSRADLAKLAAGDDPAVRAAAVVALCNTDLKSAARFAAQALTASAERAGEIFAAFLGREGGATALAQAMAATKPSRDAAQLGIEVMNSRGKRHPELMRLLTDSAGLAADTLKIDPSAMGEFLSEIRAAGDARRGEAVYRKPELGCVACHAVRGQGGTIGPDLGALGTAQPLDFIVGAILDPQKEVKEGYSSVAITTRNGDEYQGLVLREAPAEIALQDVTQNREIRLRREDLKEKQVIGSVMPEGLVNTLTRAEFRDLVRYLSELGVAKQ
ncbi:MAG: c-type cytochrome, partial [Verrucomicrobia subdivision 3 bacterium]|nr:c-type cytochrome [Limisphaerales bacterium]